MNTFPEGFTWGVATAAYQIEGAVNEDRRGQSIWDTFCHTQGKVRHGDTGDIAADHYHRYPEDVALMSEIGVSAYRFSISWPRVQPTGRGAVNHKGLDFYQRLVDELLAHSIEPWITLYHWDLPQELEDLGGWPARDTAERFADYAQTVYAALYDRVRHWLTINEPWCVAFNGYATGTHPPGRRNRGAALRAAHHLLLGHGLALSAMRAIDNTNILGIALNLLPAHPGTQHPDDLDAARRVDGVHNRIFLDPLLRGRYPDDMLDDLGREFDLTHIRAGDAATIAAPLDLLGVNYYHPVTVSGRGDGERNDPSPWVGAEDVGFVAQNLPTTAMGWEVDAQALADLLRRLDRHYPAVPLAVTENGAAYHDYADPDGNVHDPLRITYLTAHLRAAHAAIASGVDLRGYFVWSLMDNFEWAEGYSKRFGLVHIDYPSQRRLLKDSARWYRKIIEANAVPGGQP